MIISRVIIETQINADERRLSVRDIIFKHNAAT